MLTTPSAHSVKIYIYFDYEKLLIRNLSSLLFHALAWSSCFAATGSAFHLRSSTVQHESDQPRVFFRAKMHKSTFLRFCRAYVESCQILLVSLPLPVVLRIRSSSEQKTRSFCCLHDANPVIFCPHPICNWSMIVSSTLISSNIALIYRFSFTLFHVAHLSACIWRLLCGTLRFAGP